MRLIVLFLAVILLTAQAQQLRGNTQEGSEAQLKKCSCGGNQGTITNPTTGQPSNSLQKY